MDVLVELHRGGELEKADVVVISVTVVVGVADDVLEGSRLGVGVAGAVLGTKLNTGGVEVLTERRKG